MYSGKGMVVGFLAATLMTSFAILPQPAAAQASVCQTELADTASAADYLERARACWAVVLRPGHLEPEIVQRLTLESASAALELEPDNAEAYALRGQIRSVTGSRGQAIADYTLALHYDPASVDAYLGRAIAMQAIGDHMGALADYNAAVELAPDDTEALTMRGLYHYQREAWDAALADFERVTEIDPTNGDAYRTIGLIHQENGRLEEALAAFERHLEVADSPSAAVRARVMILRRDLGE